MKEILGYVIIASPLWLLVIGLVVLFGRDAAIAVLLTAAFVGFIYGAAVAGSKLLE